MTFLPAARVERILVIQVSRIGDTLLTTPALRALAAAYPAAKLAVLAHPNRAEVLDHLPFLAHVGRISKRGAPWRGWWARQHYDLALVYGFDEPLVAYALRVAKRVVAFRQADESLNRRLAVVVEPAPFQSGHAVRLQLLLPAAIGVAPQGLRLSYAVTSAERAAAQAILREVDLAAASPLIGLQVASFPTRAYRDWPIESFSELCERISAAWPQARFLIFGGNEERRRTASLKEQLGDRAALFAGRLSLRETGALMSLTQLYVGVDTGPTHLMSAFDIPLVGLYHCTSTSAFTGPLDHPCAQLLDHPHVGAECMDRSSMADISVNTVFAAVQRILAQVPQEGSSHA